LWNWNFFAVHQPWTGFDNNAVVVGLRPSLLFVAVAGAAMSVTHQVVGSFRLDLHSVSLPFEVDCKGKATEVPMAKQIIFSQTATAAAVRSQSAWTVANLHGRLIDVKVCCCLTGLPRLWPGSRPKVGTPKTISLLSCFMERAALATGARVLRLIGTGNRRRIMVTLSDDKAGHRSTPVVKA